MLTYNALLRRTMHFHSFIYCLLVFINRYISCCFHEDLDLRERYKICMVVGDELFIKVIVFQSLDTHATFNTCRHKLQKKEREKK